MRTPFNFFKLHYRSIYLFRKICYTFSTKLWKMFSVVSITLVLSGVIILVKKFKNAAFSTKLIISFVLIIGLFLCESAVSHFTSNEIVSLHQHNSYYMHGRAETILEFQQLFTEKRFFVRDTFMSLSWRNQTEPDAWHLHEALLSEYIYSLGTKAGRFIYLVETDTRFPRGSDTSHRYIMYDVMNEILVIYESIQDEFFIGRNMTFNAHDAIMNAEKIEYSILEIRNIINFNRDLLIESIYRAHRRMTVISLTAIMVAISLAVFMAITIVKAYNNKVKNIEESAIHIAQGDFNVTIFNETDEISRILSKISDIYKCFIDEINTIHNKSMDGFFDSRMNTAAFEGSHKEAALAINNLLDLVQTSMAKEAAADTRMKMMYDATPLLIEYWDENYNLIDCNPYASTFFKFGSKEEYIANFEKYFPEYQEDGTSSVAYWQKQLMLVFKGVDVNFEIALVGNNGETLYTDVVGCLLVNGEEKIAVTYSRDITESKQVIKEMERARIAEESSQAKTRFLANMSHEIRTPISAVIGISEIQLQNTALPLGVQEAFAKIYDSSRLLLNIVNDILDISKVESGKMPIIEQKYDVYQMVGETLQINMFYLGSKQIKFEVAVDENMPAFLKGDELRIKQLINNLVSNAFKYTDLGTVKLEIRCGNCDCLEDGSTVELVIVVSDTGKGMNKQQLEALKEEYTRFHELSSRNTQGTGLGMAIVSKMIALMNGELTVDSVVNVGTIVTVKLPQIAVGVEKLGEKNANSLKNFDPNSLTRTQRTSFKPVPMPYGTVLVVDDVDTNLYVAKSLLDFYSLKIETVASGYAAIDKITAGNKYDIIFMDHMMPGIDGIETTKIMRSDGYNGAIVALTANALIGQAEKFMQNGFDGFISKPIQTVHLDAILHKFIKNKHYPNDIKTEKAASSIPEGEFDDYMKNSDLLEVVYREFLESQKNAIYEIKRAIDGGEYEAAQRLAHTLKGLAGLISEKNLVELSGIMEGKFKEKTSSEEELGKLEAELHRVILLIEQKVANE